MDGERRVRFAAMQIEEVSSRFGLYSEDEAFIPATLDDLGLTEDEARYAATLAAEEGDLERLDWIFKAQVFTKNAEGVSLSFIAAKNGHLNMLPLFDEYGDKGYLYYSNDEENNALHLAILSRDAKSVRFLANKRELRFSSNLDGKTPDALLEEEYGKLISSDPSSFGGREVNILLELKRIFREVQPETGASHSGEGRSR